MKQNPSLTAVTLPTNFCCSPCCGVRPGGPVGVFAAYGHCDALCPISLQLWHRIDVTVAPTSLLSPSPTCSVGSSHFGCPSGHAATPTPHAPQESVCPLCTPLRLLSRLMSSMANLSKAIKTRMQAQHHGAEQATHQGPWDRSLPCSYRTAPCARASFCLTCF